MISCSILFEEEMGKSCIAEYSANAVTKDERQALVAGIGIVMDYWGRGYIVASREVTAWRRFIGIVFHRRCLQVIFYKYLDILL